MLIAMLSEICHCEAAGSAEEAFKHLASSPIDLILLDINMPGTSGLEFCEQIRANHNFVKIPVIFITSSVERNVQEACWLAGGSDFVKKPVVGSTLKQRVANQLKSRVVSESAYHAGFDDPLTGMKTEHYLFNEVGDVLNYCLHSSQPFSLLLVKVSGIDEINKHQGFLRGNQAIQSVARVIEGLLDVPLRRCCRIRGATFAISLPNMDESQGLKFVDEVSQALSKYLFSKGTMLPLNIRFKSAIVTSDEANPETSLVKLLDQCRTALAANKAGKYLIPDRS
ncbi:hypothetical protein GCM10011338_03910 [Alteromonas lipolytica]|nr:hypothetical protein GCM10011338_03910 [Alteromonas lipolytica]